MQRYCTELTEKLLKSLDKEYNVVDMGAVVDVITALEKTTITKEVLEITRLGKYINELRRKTNNDALAKRAKDLVRRWRDMVLPSAHSTPQPTPADPAPPALNGAKPHSPALRGLIKPQSPALRALKPQSPLIRDTTPLRVLSTSLSVHSDHSRSPNITPNKQTVTATSNHRLSPGESPKLGPATQNYSTEAVPRTHSSNKRLRKDDSENQQHHHQYHSMSSVTQYEPAVKRQRLNGENVSSSLNSQVPSPTLKERISVQFVESPTEPDSELGPKKRGRKKGSKSIKKQPFVEDRVKEKLASISRNPKLKTTQELLADLQARGSNSSVNLDVPPSQSKEPPSTEDILRSSDEQVSKYLHSGQNDASSRRSSVTADKASQNRLKHGDNGHNKAPSSKHRDADVTDSERLDSKSQESPPYRRQALTVEEILAKLPPLDLNAINWNDSDDGREEEEEDSAAVRPPREATAEDLERLHAQCIEGLNGNYQPKLSSLTYDDAANEKVERVKDLRDTDTSACRSKINNRTDEEFREWHELLARPSYDGQILHILPYVIID